MAIEKGQSWAKALHRQAQIDWPPLPTAAAEELGLPLASGLYQSVGEVGGFANRLALPFDWGLRPESLEQTVLSRF